MGLNLLWMVSPHKIPSPDSKIAGSTSEGPTSDPSHVAELKRLIQRFPFWRKGRMLLAELALTTDDVALAYAEAHALKLLAPKGSTAEGHALSILGRCFLRRGDPSTALSLLTDSQRLLPANATVTEERAAALALLGHRSEALALLREIPPQRLSKEGHAALKWLSTSMNERAS